jgi:hypothetical protein
MEQTRENKREKEEVTQLGRERITHENLTHAWHFSLFLLSSFLPFLNFLLFVTPSSFRPFLFSLLFVTPSCFLPFLPLSSFPRMVVQWCSAGGTRQRPKGSQGEQEEASRGPSVARANFKGEPVEQGTQRQQQRQR